MDRGPEYTEYASNIVGLNSLWSLVYMQSVCQMGGEIEITWKLSIKTVLYFLTRSTNKWCCACAGNMSILPYYFTKDSPSLRLDDSLEVALSLTSFDSTWQFDISGKQ